MIAETETALIDSVHRILGKTVREVASHPGHWDDAAVRMVTRTPPAVYVSWLGMKPGRMPTEASNRWALFVAARVLNGTRGDQVGAYDMAERLIASLNGARVAPSGTFSLLEAKNLWDDTQSGTGVAIYGIYFSAPGTLCPMTDEGLANLADFEQHYQTWPAANSKAPVMEADIRLDTDQEKHHE